MTIVLETARLTLRTLAVEDAPFMLRLVNEPAFVTNIGDKGVRTLEQAQLFLLNGPLASYTQRGYGHYLVSLKSTALPIGTCGLMYREYTHQIDVGFAFLPEYRGQGYATESASAVLDYGRTQLGLAEIVAVVSPDNAASIAVLRKIGLKRSGCISLAPGAAPIDLYVSS